MRTTRSAGTPQSGVSLGSELFEVVALLGSEHSLRRWLADQANRPAIVYCGTRRDTEEVAQAMIDRKALGFDTFIAELAAPFDDETIERWIGEVKPMVDRA